MKTGKWLQNRPPKTNILPKPKNAINLKMKKQTTDY